MPKLLQNHLQKNPDSNSHSACMKGLTVPLLNTTLLGCAQLIVLHDYFIQGRLMIHYVTCQSEESEEREGGS